MSVLEKTIEQYVVHKAKSKFWLVFKLNNSASDGWPDRQFITSGGHHFYIEFKQPGEKLRPLQEYRIFQLLEKSQDVYVVDNKEEGINVLQYNEEGRMGTPPISKQSYTDYDTAGSCGTFVRSWTREN